MAGRASAELAPRLILLMRDKDGGDDGDRQYAHHYPERDPYRHVNVVRGDHLQADESQDYGETVVQEVEDLHQSGEREVERAQSEDGEHVRGEHDERLA